LLIASAVMPSSEHKHGLNEKQSSDYLWQEARTTREQSDWLSPYRYSSR